VDIGEIAQRAGVARSTVSYALSGKRPISAATRARIEAVMAEADFVPNAAAQSLAQGRSGMLGLAVPSVGGHLSSSQLGLVGAVVEAAAEADHDVVLAPGGVQHASFERLVQRRRVDGVLVVEARVDDPRVRRLVRSRMPFVVVGRTTSDDDHDWVDVDYDAMVRSCVRHLVELGRRSLVLVNRSQELVDLRYGPAVRAEAAFLDECARHGVSRVVLPCPDEPGASHGWVDELVARVPGFDGVVTINESALPSLLPSLQAAGRSVPGDVSVCGVASRQLAEGTTPPLSGCDVPLRRLADTAVESLLARLGGRAHRTTVLLDLPLVERGSSRPA